VPDIITTTPSVSVTWSLTINDLGFINSLGATYSVSVTQVSGTTGTLTINPTTGQYTFVPNPSFTGSTQTTYTICNTALNPQVCSSSSITIFVGINPLAVNDATNTIQNTPVISSAGLNDNGAQSALNPSFTCGSSSNGTIVMNPSNGQFTFTPANGFTGTVSITYTLCNIMPVNCSTAAITISVYPMIVANIDVVNTTPSVSTTGSLLLNDLGIVSGGTLTANYSVTITQPSPTVGVFTINPATGQYTFVPAPAFVGTAQTTYTVCNTSLIPAVCASTTININVFANPVPVNDTVKTLINTPVIANVSLNDIGSTGGTYSITGQPSGGSIVINNSTGQYTFTPSSTFTGVTTATYQLCNGAPVTCSTAIITITVYPALQANDDNIVTTPNTTVGGTLTLNDLGILPGGTYSINTNPLPPSTGTLVVNASTGQYTFIPNPLFDSCGQCAGCSG
jgi:hypothetical protein